MTGINSSLEQFSYIHSALRRTVFYCLSFSLLGILMTSSPVLAQVEQETAQAAEATLSTEEEPSFDQFDDPYTVENIEVDITADNAVEAREKAFEEAQLIGYERLARRFLPDAEKENFEPPGIETVSMFVKDFEVTDEKLSAYRYKGTYTIRFSPRTFQKPDMNGLYQGQQAAMPQQGEVLVVPFYETGGRYYLWQTNPFLEAWARAKSNNVLGKAIVPIGDLDDLTQLQGEQGLSYDPSRLNAMRLRYRANDVALMIASPEVRPDGSKNIVVSLYNAKPYGPELAEQFSIKGYRGELDAQLFNRVVSTVSQLLHRGWKRQTAVQAANNNPETAVEVAPISGPKSTIMAQINFTSAREWVDTKKSIERADGVQSVQVKSLSPRSATMSIQFVGDVQALRTSLLQQGVGLNDPQTQYAQNAAGGDTIYQLYPAQRPGRYY
jgi:hypothetical protein